MDVDTTMLLRCANHCRVDKNITRSGFATKHSALRHYLKIVSNVRSPPSHVMENAMHNSVTFHAKGGFSLLLLRPLNRCLSHKVDSRMPLWNFFSLLAQSQANERGKS
jgi:hypothetical protein